ncbi:MAG: hypothetical protein ABI954_05890, partial [Pyrinomonadaceae bacterium]
MEIIDLENSLKNPLKLSFYIVITLCCINLVSAQQPLPTTTPVNRERVAVPQESPKPKGQQSEEDDEVIKVNSKLV